VGTPLPRSVKTALSDSAEQNAADMQTHSEVKQ
jgi:hypothetical protein